MTTRTLSASVAREETRNFSGLVKTMTFMAWLALIVGVVLCAINITEFNDENMTLMVGIGFLVGSVHIYVIKTAIHLVNNQAKDQANK